MQAVWITRTPDSNPAQKKDIIVFAAGWAGSDELVRHLTLPESYDMLCLFDYRRLPDTAEAEELYAQIAPYRHKHLVAWSFGVWAAVVIFGDSPLHWDTATAINGTPLPISDDYGIPWRAFAVTVRSIGGTGTGKFLERMCDTPEILREYYRHRSTRPLEEIYDELQSLQHEALATASEGLPAPGFWTAAMIGGRDAIFPPENMARYWGEASVPLTTVETMPHYPLFDPNILIRLIHEAR